MRFLAFFRGARVIENKELNDAFKGGPRFIRTRSVTGNVLVNK